MIYDYTITTGKGEQLSLSEFKGKVIMVVNTATEMLSPALSRQRIWRKLRLV